MGGAGLGAGRRPGFQWGSIRTCQCGERAFRRLNPGLAAFWLGAIGPLLSVPHFVLCKMGAVAVPGSHGCCEERPGHYQAWRTALVNIVSAAPDSL